MSVRGTTDLPPRVRHVRCQRMNRLILDAARGLSLTHIGHRLKKPP